MKKISLNGAWTLKGYANGGFEQEDLCLPATVPGTAQLELAENGYLPKDLYMGDHITAMEAYEGWNWSYETVFTLTELKPRAFLMFRGVDCFATYELNGVCIGKSDNMLIPFEFDVSEYLKIGENRLCVKITSPMEVSYCSDPNLVSMAVAPRPIDGISVRRPPHSYGWDIMPHAVTSGIWRDVYLEFRDEFYFSQLYFVTHIKDKVRLCYDITCKYRDFQFMEIEVEGRCKNSCFHIRIPIRYKAGSFEIDISDPQYWMPYGYGDSNLYDAVVRIYTKGKVVHEKITRFGIRTVKLERTAFTDGKKGAFRFLINDVEVMVKGSNWVPLDAFHSRDKGRLQRALSLAKDIGCNILRCWGGNVYEDHEFFDFCDENGIMVWQDFIMACNYYPVDTTFLQNLEKEVVGVLREYRRHPSIIAWSGDNEIDMTLKFKGFNPDQNYINRVFLPNLVFHHDVGRPFIESSPYITKQMIDEFWLTPSEEHLWGARNYFKDWTYKHFKGHFISEIGYLGCPSVESVKKFIPHDELWPMKGNGWIQHSADQEGNDFRLRMAENEVREFFSDLPDTLEEFSMASQIVQAEALKFFIEHFRVGRPDKCGVIWWNLLDGWPQLSDAVVDYYFEKKLAYDYIKISQAPFVIVADELHNWKLPIIACNDTLVAQNGTVQIIDGESREILLDMEFTAPANTSSHLADIRLYSAEQRLLLIRWKSNGQEGKNHYLTGYPSFSLERYRKWLNTDLLS